MSILLCTLTGFSVHCSIMASLRPFGGSEILSCLTVMELTQPVRKFLPQTAGKVLVSLSQVEMPLEGNAWVTYPTHTA